MALLLGSCASATPAGLDLFEVDRGPVLAPVEGPDAGRGAPCAEPVRRGPPPDAGPCPLDPPPSFPDPFPHDPC